MPRELLVGRPRGRRRDEVQVVGDEALADREVPTVAPGVHLESGRRDRVDLARDVAGHGAGIVDRPPMDRRDLVRDGPGRGDGSPRGPSRGVDPLEGGLIVALAVQSQCDAIPEPGDRHPVARNADRHALQAVLVHLLLRREPAGPAQQGQLVGLADVGQDGIKRVVVLGRDEAEEPRLPRIAGRARLAAHGVPVDAVRRIVGERLAQMRPRVSELQRHVRRRRQLHVEVAAPADPIREIVEEHALLVVAIERQEVPHGTRAPARREIHRLGAPHAQRRRVAEQRIVLDDEGSIPDVDDVGRGNAGVELGIAVRVLSPPRQRIG